MRGGERKRGNRISNRWKTQIDQRSNQEESELHEWVSIY